MYEEKLRLYSTGALELEGRYLNCAGCRFTRQDELLLMKLQSHDLVRLQLAAVGISVCGGSSYIVLFEVVIVFGL